MDIANLIGRKETVELHEIGVYTLARIFIGDDFEVLGDLAMISLHLRREVL